MAQSSRIRLTVLSILAVLSFSLLSVKWMFAPAAFAAPALLILLMDRLKPARAFWLGWLVLYCATLVGSYRVMPFPWFVFIVISLVVSFKMVLPFFIYRLAAPRLRGWMLSLAFPVLYVAYDYLNSFDGSGTWGSIAYSQVNNPNLMQLTAVTGLWGITFIICWGSSLLARTIPGWSGGFFLRKETGLYLSVLLLVLLFGNLRRNTLWQEKTDEVRVAGISAQNLRPLLSAYEAAFGKTLQIDLNQLTQTSPELAELNRGFALFIENPEDQMFAGTHLQLEQFHDALLDRAAIEARAGAKIIVFSEALFVTTKKREDRLIDKAKAISNQHKVYVLLSMAAIIPGKVAMGSKYLENKTLLINPQGQVENTFFKNIPVPLVEASIAGNGEVPVIATPYGRIAISICYDADFPGLIRQASAKEADLLLLPSGDWREISPYHGLMASVRAIENGLSLVRPVSGASSVAVDNYGGLIAAQVFDNSKINVLVAEVPAARVQTVYAHIGDLFAWVSIGFALFLTAFSFLRKMPAGG